MRMRLLAVLLAACVAGSSQAAESPVDGFLREGRLAEGAKALEAQLKTVPEDDTAHYGLGVIRFLQSFEHLGTSLYRYGLRTNQVLRFTGTDLGQLIEQNPNPEKIGYSDLRKVLQTWVDDLAAADAELAKVKDRSVKLPLHVGQAKLDLLGRGKPVSAALLFSRWGNDDARRQAENLVVAFDHGDAVWLRGYIHFLSAMGELLLAVDGQESFETTAHLFFEKVDSPHAFLQEGPRAWDDRNVFSNREVITDLIAWLHTMRFPIKDAAKMKAVLSHLEATTRLGREMWDSILAETDDDQEWIPNPKQTGVMRVKVTDEMVATWRTTLEEAERVLQGKKLLPFWRGNQPDRGVNLRRVFTEPCPLDPFLWLQGTAATPYLEKGSISYFANREFFTQINQSFGTNFFGFMFWFN